MPILSSRGSLSARSMGQLLKRRKQALSVNGIVVFNLGNTSLGLRTKAREIHALVADTITPTTSMLGASAYQSAISNSVVGIVAVGYNGGNTKTRESYRHSTQVSEVATSASDLCYSGSGCGNATMGIFSLGYNGNYTASRDKYVYETQINSLATAATIAACNGAAAGNATKGIIAPGVSSAGALTTTNVYEYAKDTCVVGTSLVRVANLGAAASNANLVVFATGASTSTLCLYDITASTSIVTGSLLAKMNQGSGGGGDTLALFDVGAAGGGLRSRYSYTTRVCTAAKTSATTNWLGSAFSTGITGVTV